MNTLRANQKATAFSALQKLARPSAKIEAVEVCELCSINLFPQHRHLLEVAKRKIACACDPCALRFENVIEGKFKLIPRDARPLDDFKLTDMQWENLALPIDLVFIFNNSVTGKPSAAYPSPAGVTESLLTIENWETMVAENPELGNLAPDVEALLINRVGETREYYIAPVDVCFELAGLIRKHWRGFSGGEIVWHELEKFFGRLREQTSSHKNHREEVYA